MSNPRFTFCIPNLNKIQYLPACIESMLAQDCSDWKCVFVDGYSTDGSWEYIQQFASDSRFLLLRGVKQGMYADWNECLKYVNTEYFYFLTSDDTCFPNLVSTTVTYLDTYSNIDACHFQYAIIDQNGDTLSSYTKDIQSRFTLYGDVIQYPHIRSGICEFMMHFVYRSIYTTITSLVFRRNLIQKLKKFGTIYGPAADYDWTMRMTLFTDVLYIPMLLATWRTYEDQITRKSSPVTHKTALLKIASENLSLFSNTEHAQSLKKCINYQYMLADFFDEHASYIYAEVFLSKTLSNAIKYAVLATLSYPTYPAKKIINRLSRNGLYVYPARIDLAKKIIDEYGVQWPPAPLDFQLDLQRRLCHLN
jgi:glycosyltransferase involved in cell wall biosynthesis